MTVLGREFTVNFDKDGSIAVLEGQHVILTVADFFPEFTSSLLYQREASYSPRLLLERLVKTTQYGYTIREVYLRLTEEVRWGFIDAEKKAVAAKIARRNGYILEVFGQDIVDTLCHISSTERKVV